MSKRTVEGQIVRNREPLIDCSFLDVLCIVLRETYHISWNLTATCRSLQIFSLADNTFDRWLQFMISRKLSKTFRCYLLTMARHRYDGGNLTKTQFLQHRNNLFSQRQLFRKGLYFFDPDDTRLGLYPNIAPIVSVPYLLNPELLQTDIFRITRTLKIHNKSIHDDLTECPLFLSDNDLELIARFISKSTDLNCAFNFVHCCIIRNIQPSVVKKLFLLFDYQQSLILVQKMKLAWSIHKEFDCSKLAPYCDKYNGILDPNLLEYFNLEETLIYCDWFCHRVMVNPRLNYTFLLAHRYDYRLMTKYNGGLTVVELDLIAKCDFYGAIHYTDNAHFLELFLYRKTIQCQEFTQQAELLFSLLEFKKHREKLIEYLPMCHAYQCAAAAVAAMLCFNYSGENISRIGVELDKIGALPCIVDNWNNIKTFTRGKCYGESYLIEILANHTVWQETLSKCYPNYERKNPET